MNEVELVCFKMIAALGAARSAFMEAIVQAKKGHFEEASSLIEEGQQQRLKGHEIHFELLQKAIEEEKNAFSEVNNAAYSLEPVSDERLVKIAKDVNKQLGYELYDKLDRESLVADFSTTSREMYKYTLDKSKFLNDRLEKALVEHCDDILIDVVKAHENFDSMETYELYTLAFEVNEKLGYRLFRDIYSYSLKRDFERVAKAVETYKKEGKITKFMK